MTHIGTLPKLPKDQFDSHMATLRQLVRKEYPNIYPDTYMFMSAIGFVIATAAFSIVARGLEISMWYPLLILVAPAILAYWTTRRRSVHYIKMNNVSVDDDARMTKNQHDL